MTAQTDTFHLPRHISLFLPLIEPLLAKGVPLGPNGLITIRGRKSGLPRTNGVALIEINSRRWVWCPWGDAQWVRNLRAAGRATITKGRKTEEVSATELDEAEKVEFFRNGIGALAGSIPGGFTFIRLIDGVDLHDPVQAAKGRPVFELVPVR
jgi:deazaflavin-dependent oxidoreductase (nitroreductase family)